MSPDVNISLEPHLLSALRPIFPLLPNDLASQLEQYIVDSPPATIPYDILLRLSQWTRTDEGQRVLKEKDLDVHDYSMIALLAGSTTSPERKFGSYVPPKDPEEIEAARVKERKTITVLLNALLSIGCVGFAAWWAGGRTGWKPEWRALFALFAALVVAIAEAGLYLIWSYRHSPSRSASRPKRRSARHKKVDPAIPENDVPQIITDSTNETTAPDTLRLRR